MSSEPYWDMHYEYHTAMLTSSDFSIDDMADHDHFFRHYFQATLFDIYLNSIEVFNRSKLVDFSNLRYSNLGHVFEQWDAKVSVGHYDSERFNHCGPACCP